MGLHARPAIEAARMKAAIIVGIAILVFALVGLAAIWLVATGWFDRRKKSTDRRHAKTLRARLGYPPPDLWARVLEAHAAGTGLHPSAAEVERLAGVDAILRAALEVARAADRENAKKLEIALDALDAVLAAKPGGES